MTVTHTEIRVQGKPVLIPSTPIAGRTTGVTGKLLKKAAVLDEEFLDCEPVVDPEAFVAALKKSDLKADVITFAQHLPGTQPRYKQYRLEWDSAAAVAITSYQEWLEKQVEYDVRKAIKKAAKLGVVVKAVPFDDALIRGITGIYNECPVRQGKAFWHYQKDFDTVKKEKSTFLDRSEFIGAFYQDELIGFIKMVYIGKIASTLHVLSQKCHADKKPTNALLAKAVEICEQKGLTHLVYGNYRYDQINSSLTEFKRRNGFHEILVPRYYIPLTLTGWLALKLGLHHGIKAALPTPLLKAARSVRSTFYRLLRPAAESGKGAGKAEAPASSPGPALARPPVASSSERSSVNDVGARNDHKAPKPA
jgi:hypothetical protein